MQPEERKREREGERERRHHTSAHESDKCGSRFGVGVKISFHMPLMSSSRLAVIANTIVTTTGMIASHHQELLLVGQSFGVRFSGKRVDRGRRARRPSGPPWTLRRTAGRDPRHSAPAGRTCGTDETVDSGSAQAPGGLHLRARARGLGQAAREAARARRRQGEPEQPARHAKDQPWLD